MSNNEGFSSHIDARIDPRPQIEKLIRQRNATMQKLMALHESAEEMLDRLRAAYHNELQSIGIEEISAWQGVLDDSKPPKPWTKHELRFRVGRCIDHVDVLSPQQVLDQILEVLDIYDEDNPDYTGNP